MQAPDLSQLLDVFIAALLPSLLWLIPLLLLSAALRRLFPQVLGWTGEARVGREFARLFPEVANDLILPDGRGALTQVDHLALGSGGILVIETKHYSGRIFGRERESTWTQVAGRQRNRLQNPLRQNYGHIKAVESLGLGVPVHGCVVFSGTAEFPNGMPPGVCGLSGLAGEVGELTAGSVPPPYRAAWDRLLESARQDSEARKAHLAQLGARHGPVASARLPVLLLVVSVGWLAGVWIYQDPIGSLPLAHRPERAEQPVPLPRAEPPVARPNSTAPAPPQILPPSVPDASGSGVRAPRPASAPAVASTLVGSGSGSGLGHRQVTIGWSGEPGADESCSLARVAVLIDNTPENRRARDLACGERPPDRVGAAR